MDFSSFQALLAADPKFQQLVAAAKQAYAAGGRGSANAAQVRDVNAYAYGKAKETGTDLPDGYSVEPTTGKFVPNAAWDWGKAALALAPIALGFGLAAAGVGGAGAAAGAGTGAIDAATVPAASAGAGAAETGAGLLPATQIGAGAIGPITGGTGAALSAVPGASLGLPDWLKTAKDIGSSLGDFSSGRAAGRVVEGTAQQQQARTADQLYNTQLRAPSTIAGNSVRGDILANAQDVALAAPADIPIPHISGGLRPSMFSPTTRATGRTITQNASDSANLLRPANPPVLPDLQGANGLDSFLNTASLVGNLAGPVAKIGSKIPWGKIFG